ncbi:MAG: hypothetical protein QG650_1168, partial [Patescibacteria group bacterium]|nr:hypothetical protein [Patescibacteria group bacterium]
MAKMLRKTEDMEKSDGIPPKQPEDFSMSSVDGKVPTPFAELSRELFDAQDETAYSHVSSPGLSEEVVRRISTAQKN